MGIVLFDWKSPSACKKVKNALLARVCLFDGYLTEPISCPHFGMDAYLTKKPAAAAQMDLYHLFSDTYLFDGCLIKIPLFTLLSSH